MMMRPLQNQVTDIAVFGLTVAFLGFMTKMVRDMTAGAMGSAKAPALLPVTVRSYTADQIFARAKAYFGATANPDEAGYILSDGKRPTEELEEYLPASIPRDDLKRIADKYSWWAAKLAEAVCPHNDVACVEREARRLAETRRARLK